MKLQEKYLQWMPLAVSYVFAILFLYAASSKLLEFDSFRVQLGQSPLLSVYSGMIAPGIITIEIVIATLLFWKPARHVGLYASYTLMVMFSVYIYLILHYSDFVPCSCGGILEKMSWDTHLYFNVGCCILLLLTLLLPTFKNQKL